MKTLLNTLSYMFLLTCMINLASCNSETEYDDIQSVPQLSKQMDENTAIARFTQILSKATYEREEVRQFLKDEALKQFDKNYDVLYAKVKDYEIGGNTFHGILEEYSSTEELESILRSVPTLNIYVPKISMFNISADNMDVTDKEIPVVNPCDRINYFYINGDIADSIKVGEIPAFHTFVVNRNSRVNVNVLSRSNGCSYSFIDAAFNGETCSPSSRSSIVGSSMVGNKAIEAYNYFNTNDNTTHSVKLQRDYIYYGLTPTSSTGTLNRNVTEYISFIEVDPLAYFTMTDKKEIYPNTNDPEIKKESTTKEGSDYTQSELLNEFWTKGAYNIRVEILMSTAQEAYVKYIPVKPDDIWNFNYDRTYVHRTLFRHSKYTYKIDPYKFTAKHCDVSAKNIDFAKWDLAEESLMRELHFYEEDPGDTVSHTYRLEVTNASSSKVTGSSKVGYGDGVKLEYANGIETTGSETTKEIKEIVSQLKNNDDNLGMARIYFYDPLILGRSGSDYEVQTYSTGSITFGITVK